MPYLILASRNAHKAEEIAVILGDRFRIQTLADFPNAPEVVEDGDTPAILLAESVEQDRLIGTDNQREAVLAGMQNRAPVFQPAAKFEEK